ncbi:hypothetical protein [Micromonospora eburnea]|uniref:hypothetical protein n=1 Tax=Micromonospora eburnea TaxID=227316 RepID=UPI001428D700|nr:hypothetical protein [Micromonospora eburnea]
MTVTSALSNTTVGRLGRTAFGAHRAARAGTLAIGAYALLGVLVALNYWPEWATGGSRSSLNW